MSLAVTGSIDAKAQLQFKERIEAEAGSFYLMAIEQDEVVMAASDSLEEIKKIFAGTSKPIIAGVFWEEGLEYNWDGMESDNILRMDVSGTFAFELDDEAGLEGYDVDDGPIETLLIAWAEDGDSPKRIPAPVEVDGSLSDCTEDSEFEGV